MIDIPLTPSGRVHPCYPYFEQFQFCASKTHYERADCQHWLQDYRECTGKTKLSALMVEAEQERRKQKLISVPHYSRQLDAFVFDDGRVVSNSDNLFKDIPWR